MTSALINRPYIARTNLQVPPIYDEAATFRLASLGSIVVDLTGATDSFRMQYAGIDPYWDSLDEFVLPAGGLYGWDRLVIPDGVTQFRLRKDGAAGDPAGVIPFLQAHARSL